MRTSERGKCAVIEWPYGHALHLDEPARTTDRGMHDDKGLAREALLVEFTHQLVVGSVAANPRGYTNVIKKYISYFDGNLLNLPGSEESIETQEGPAAYQEAIDFLSKQSGVGRLEPSKGLCKIAKDFVSEMKKVDPGDIGSIDLDKIIERYGKFTGNLNRALDMGGETPEQVLVNLIVSDGEPNREQRESLLNKDFNKVGVGFGTHDELKYVTTIISASKFENKVDVDDRGIVGNTKYNKP